VRDAEAAALIEKDHAAVADTLANGKIFLSALGAKVEGMGFVVELDFLNGRKKFDGTEVFSLLHYDK
jgi:adenine/guanine phosphoribosyltransferase-like PRPP-binding protein